MGFRFEITSLFDYGANPISLVPRLNQRVSNAKSPKDTKKNDPEPSLEFGTFIGDRQITLVLDLKAYNESNPAEGWRTRHAHHKAQKKEIFVALVNCKQIIKMPCSLKFIRYAPKFLDYQDNLPMSFKYILDYCCAQITGDHRPGRADSNKGFTFQYDQVKSKKYYVKIEISW